jgi:hypothetical protein
MACWRRPLLRQNPQPRWVLLLLPLNRTQRRLLLTLVLCLLPFGTAPRTGLAAALWHLLLGAGLTLAHTATATMGQQRTTCATACSWTTV